MRTVAWDDGAVKMIDQRALPWELDFVPAGKKPSKPSPRAYRDMTDSGGRPLIGAAKRRNSEWRLPPGRAKPTTLRR